MKEIDRSPVQIQNRPLLSEYMFPVNDTSHYRSEMNANDFKSCLERNL